MLQEMQRPALAVPQTSQPAAQPAAATVPVSILSSSSAVTPITKKFMSETGVEYLFTALKYRLLAEAVAL